jgi:hypothetical protein
MINNCSLYYIIIQIIVNKRPWTGAEENNPCSSETIEKRIRTDELSDERSDEPSDEPSDDPNVYSAESPTESLNDQVSHLFGATLVVGHNNHSCNV